MFQKGGVGTRRLVFLVASPLVTAPPSNLTRLYYNGSAAKSHSITTQYRQLRRLSDSRSLYQKLKFYCLIINEPRWYLVTHILQSRKSLLNFRTCNKPRRLFLPKFPDRKKRHLNFPSIIHRNKVCPVTGISCTYTMHLGTDARSHFAMRARFEMQQGNYQEALRFLSMALSQIPPFLGQVAAPLLADRAECFWQLGDAGKAVQEMMEATNAGLPAYGESSKVIFVFLIPGAVFSFMVTTSK